jgi:DNA polymerase-3 subunit alpha
LIQALVTVGFTADESEYIRRIIGKKKRDEMPKWKDKVFETCEKNGFGEQVAEAIWKVMLDSADYSFNKSHSYCVAYLGALTVYLKYKYPLEFFTACLNAIQKLPDPMDEIRQIERELPYFNIKLLPPSLLKSDIGFTVEGKNIRYGLSAIKGVSDSSIEKLIKFRGEYDNKIDCFLAAKQAGLNIGILSSLIQAGALDDLGSSRPHLVLQSQAFNLLTDKEKRLVKTLHDEGDNKNILSIIQLLVDKKQIKESRFETFKKKYSPYRQIYELNSRNEELTNYFYEKNCLGFSYSQNLTDIFKQGNHNFITIKDAFETREEDDRVLLIGEIIEPTRQTKSRNGNKFLKANIADDTGKISVLLFDGRFGLFEDCKSKNGGQFPEEGDIVIVKGRLKGTDAIFADELIKQDCKIYKNMRDLK